MKKIVVKMRVLYKDQSVRGFNWNFGFVDSDWGFAFHLWPMCLIRLHPRPSIGLEFES